MQRISAAVAKTASLSVSKFGRFSHLNVIRLFHAGANIDPAGVINVVIRTPETTRYEI